MKFECLPLCQPLLRGLQEAGYQQATPIQQEAIPEALKGRDLVGCAQTGTGKTAAFTLPTLQRLMSSDKTPGDGPARKKRRVRPIRSLILAPTRELAGQIGDSLETYGIFTGLRHTVIYGGVGQRPQVRALQAGVDLLVATPGRLLDLIGQGYVNLDAVEVLILDEADQMLDMGFLPDLRKIVAKTPDQRQTLMFSATMPKEVRKLADQWLKHPHEVNVAAVASTPTAVSQMVYFVERPHKPAVLTRFLQETPRSKTLVFSRTKRGADKIARRLERDGIAAVSIHGDKSQSKRQAVMRQFNSQRPPVLVATDLASRGLDFSDVSHVVNYDLPDTPETYVHRIGRTARAGASGQAVTFCGSDERRQLRMIEKLTGLPVDVETMPGMTVDQPATDGSKKSDGFKHRPPRYSQSAAKASAGSKRRKPAKASAKRRKKKLQSVSDR